jgi:hypothetical protein
LQHGPHSPAPSVLTYIKPAAIGQIPTQQINAKRRHYWRTVGPLSSQNPERPRDLLLQCSHQTQSLATAHPLLARPRRAGTPGSPPAGLLSFHQ